MDKVPNLKLSYEFMKYVDDNTIEALDEFLPILEKYCENNNNHLLHTENNGGKEFVNLIHDFSNLVMSIESEEYVLDLMSMISSNTSNK
jgi:hypothetical protein